MIKFKFSRDVNGNSIIKVKRAGFRGFSIQTNGNLPQTHSMRQRSDSGNQHIIEDEVRAWCICYGTERQMKITCRQNTSN